ncbi:MAG: hypothetical protein JO250_01265 [Armatimonadetes bacterium]|nr:hypothetical protein [Armatimonadota bacterium]
MALDDYLEPEVGVAVAVTAAVASPQVRGVLRRGAVYGLAGILKAGDAVSAMARGVRRGVQDATATDGAATVATTADAPAVVVAETPPATAAEPAETPHRRATRKSSEASNGE